MDTSLEVLHRVFGYDSFRTGQQEIIEHVVARRRRARAHADRRRQVAVLPDPGARPARASGVVVSPLIALMQDQVDALHRARRARGVPQLDAGLRRAAAGRGGVPRGRARPALPRARAAAGRGHAAAARPRATISLFAIDEAHCVVAVGARLPSRLPGAVGAARALARGAAHRADRDRHRRATHAEIAERLGLEQARHFVASFDRPNIHYRIDHQERAQAPAPRFPAHRAPRRGRHRLLPVALLGREDRRVPGRQRHRRAALPRGPRRPHPRRQPGPLPA